MSLGAQAHPAAPLQPALVQAVAIAVVARRRRDEALASLQRRCNDLEEALEKQDSACRPINCIAVLRSGSCRDSQAGVGLQTCTAELWHAASRLLPDPHPDFLARLQQYILLKTLNPGRGGEPRCCESSAAASLLERTPLVAVLEATEDVLVQACEQKDVVDCVHPCAKTPGHADTEPGSLKTETEALAACLGCLAALLDAEGGAVTTADDVACLRSFLRWIVAGHREDWARCLPGGELLDRVAGASPRLLLELVAAAAEELSAGVTRLVHAMHGGQGMPVVAVDLRAPEPSLENAAAAGATPDACATLTADCQAACDWLHAWLPRLPPAWSELNRDVREQGTARAAAAIVAASQACALVVVTHAQLAVAVQSAAGRLVALLHELERRELES